jgi:tripartite-type tricarboxylate transporter receptor subunit TctC
MHSLFCPARRRQLGLAAALFAGVMGCATLTAKAQDFPTKPVRIVVPFGPGGVGDLTARAVAQKLSEGWGKPVVIDNKPGAGGVVAADTVAKAEPDGHTLFLLSNGTAVTQGLFKNLPFDAVRDFVPLSTLGYFDVAVVVPEGSPFKSFKDLVSHARAHPGKLNVGSINVGSTQNLAAELFKSSAGIEAQVVPFNGTPALINALRGQQVDVGVEILGPVLPQVRGNALRVLAVTGERRSVVLPDVPTAKESGVPGFVAASWNALAAPARTPREVVHKLHRDIAAAIQSPEVRKRLQDLNVDAHSSTPEQTADLLASDIKRWGAVITRANIPRQ